MRQKGLSVHVRVEIHFLHCSYFPWRPPFLDSWLLAEDRSELVADQVSLGVVCESSHHPNGTMLCSADVVLLFSLLTSGDLSQLSFHVMHTMIVMCNLRPWLCHRRFQARYLPCHQTRLSLYPIESWSQKLHHRDHHSWRIGHKYQSSQLCLFPYVIKTLFLGSVVTTVLPVLVGLVELADQGSCTPGHGSCAEGNESAVILAVAESFYNFRSGSSSDTTTLAQLLLDAAVTTVSPRSHIRATQLFLKTAAATSPTLSTCKLSQPHVTAIKTEGLSLRSPPSKTLASETFRQNPILRTLPQKN